MLDALGLDEEGRRGLPLAHRQRRAAAPADPDACSAFLPWPQQMEMVAQHWRSIGIFAEVRETGAQCSPSPARRTTSTTSMLWTNGGTELLYLFPRHAIPVDPTEAFMGPRIRQMVRVGRPPRARADRPGPEEDLRAVRRRRRPEGRTSATRPRRRSGRSWWTSSTVDRHGRPVAGPDGRAAREPQARQHPVARLHRAALPHARQFTAGDVVLSVLGRDRLDGRRATRAVAIRTLVEAQKQGQLRIAWLIIDQLAASHSVSSDGLTYTFTLRPNLKFSDGTPLTASDVAYSINRTLLPATQSDVRVYLSLLKDFEQGYVRYNSHSHWRQPDRQR